MTMPNQNDIARACRDLADSAIRLSIALDAPVQPATVASPLGDRPVDGAGQTTAPVDEGVTPPASVQQP